MSKVEIRYDRVADALHDAVTSTEPGSEQEWYSYALPHLVAHQLGIFEAWSKPSTTTEYALVTRFNNQVGRAASQLAKDGGLVKIGRGGRLPSGQYLGNEARFYTPAGYKAAQERAESDRQAAEALATRWAVVYDVLADRGIPFTSPDWRAASEPLRARGKEVHVTLEGFEQLLQLGEPS